MSIKSPYVPMAAHSSSHNVLLALLLIRNKSSEKSTNRSANVYIQVHHAPPAAQVVIG